MRYAIYVMVGPGEAERRRLGTLLQSLFRHEPGLPLLVIVNDTGGAIPSLEGVPASCEVVNLQNPRPPDTHARSRNILRALRYLSGRRDVDFAFKLDTDALVIAPFSEKIGHYFMANPGIGQVGLADRDCFGKRVDFGFYQKFSRRLRRGIQVWRSPRWGVAQAYSGRRALVRRVMRLAAANGIYDGLHCQGGAHAVSKVAIQRMAEKGWLADDRIGDPFVVADDLMVSAFVGAAGLGLASLSGPGEPFALVVAGLPMPPAELAAKGYSIIHSIKNDSAFSEARIVAYFTARDDRARAANTTE